MARLRSVPRKGRDEASKKQPAATKKQPAATKKQPAATKKRAAEPERAVAAAMKKAGKSGKATCLRWKSSSYTSRGR